MPGEVSMLKAALLAIGAFFGYKKATLELDNTPEMKARAGGAADQAVKDGAAKAIATRDTATIEKLISCLVLGLLVLTSMPGCRSTVTPAPVVAKEASFGDSGKQNSGFLGWVEGGALIDAGARDRYNALIKLYGRDLLPTIEEDHGLKKLATAWFISNSAIQNFALMSEWKRMGRVPR